MSDTDLPMMCWYCRNYPAVEWSDQGRAQCHKCSPPTTIKRKEADQ